VKIASWNVNGLRSILEKTLPRFVEEADPDVLCLQETKVNPGTIPDCFGGSYAWRAHNCAVKRGYSGTAVFSKIQPENCDLRTRPEGLLEPAEGRVMVLDFGAFHLVNVYTPNARAELTRLPLRERHWDPAFRDLLLELDGKKPVLACGDFNVAHRPIDLAHPEANRGSAGFTDGERAGFDGHLAAGFVDIFRHLHPDRAGAYSWWSYRGGARGRNVGWRIDYFLGSARLLPSVTRCEILPAVGGSDHAPLILEFSPGGPAATQ
jgi:exodeoxyribonuclease-3